MTGSCLSRHSLLVGFLFRHADRELDRLPSNLETLAHAGIGCGASSSGERVSPSSSLTPQVERIVFSRRAGRSSCRVRFTSSLFAGCHLLADAETWKPGGAGPLALCGPPYR